MIFWQSDAFTQNGRDGRGVRTSYKEDKENFYMAIGTIVRDDIRYAHVNLKWNLHIVIGGTEKAYSPCDILPSLGLSKFCAYLYNRLFITTSASDYQSCLLTYVSQINDTRWLYWSVLFYISLVNLFVGLSDHCRLFTILWLILHWYGCHHYFFGWTNFIFITKTLYLVSK